MIDYIIVYVLCGLIVIANMIMLQSHSLDGKFHLKNIIISLILSFAIAFVSITLIKTSNKQDEEKIKEWNNGYCTECGGKWTFINGTYNRYNTKIYYYKCDECGKVIEQQKLR